MDCGGAGWPVPGWCRGQSVRTPLAGRARDRVRKVGLDELLQFDWTLVGESDALAAEDWPALDQVGTAGVEARLRRIRDVIGERRRYLEILA